MKKTFRSFPFIYCFILFPAFVFSQTFDVSLHNLRINTPECKNAQAAKNLHRTLNGGLKKHFNVPNQSVFNIGSHISIKNIESDGRY